MASRPGPGFSLTHASAAARAAFRAGVPPQWKEAADNLLHFVKANYEPEDQILAMIALFMTKPQPATVIQKPSKD
jgi:hypothetical protein